MGRGFDSVCVLLGLALYWLGAIKVVSGRMEKDLAVYLTTTIQVTCRIAKPLARSATITF